MSMVVQHNLTAMNSNRMLGVTTSAQAKSSEKLSSGYKINRAADDAAGLTISEKMRKQMKGLTRASTNAQDGVSAVQTAEGALTEVHSMLQRMNELATQAANGTNSEADRDAIQAEIDQLTTEIDRVSETTKFNETYLLKGEEAGTTVEKKLNAHDAGLDGKLVDNGSTATFTKVLEDGDKIKIAGEEYTIGSGSGKSGGKILDPEEMNTSTDGYADITDAIFATTTLAAGDSVTYNGETYTLVDKIAVDDITFKAGDIFTVGDIEYTLTNTASDDGSTVTAGKANLNLGLATNFIKDALAEGKQVKAAATTGVQVSQVAAGTTANANAQVTGINIVASLEKGEVSTGKIAAAALNAPTLAKAGSLGGGTTAVTLGAGDSVTKGGVTTTATASTPTAAKDVYDSIQALVAGDTVKIGSGRDAITYTIVDSEEDADEEAFKLTKEAILSKIHDGDVVDDGNGAVTVIGDIGAPAGNDNVQKTISAAEAYEKMAEELQKASSIGADEDKQATVASDGKGGFTITKGSTTVKEELFFNLHVGADADMTNKIGVTIEAMSAANLGIKDLDVIGKDENGRNINDGGIAATYAIDAIADAISKVSAQRSALGAVQNRLDHTIANLDNVVENTTAAESRIRDTDMATEMVEYSKNNILAQAGQSMLAQANQSNQGVLSLLG